MPLSRERFVSIKLRVVSALQNELELSTDQLQQRIQVNKASLYKVLKGMKESRDLLTTRRGRITYYRLASPEVALELTHSAPTALGADLLGTTFIKFFPHGFVTVFADFLVEAQVRVSSGDYERFNKVAPELLTRLATLVNFFQTAAQHLQRRDLKAEDFFNSPEELEKFLNLQVYKGFHLGETEKTDE